MSIVPDLAKGLGNVFPPISRRSIISDRIPYPTLPDLDKLLQFIPPIVELLMDMNKDKELARHHEREMLEKLLKGQIIELRAEERRRLINALDYCIENANTHEDKMVYLEMYYRLTKEPIMTEMPTAG